MVIFLLSQEFAGNMLLFSFLYRSDNTIVESLFLLRKISFSMRLYNLLLDKPARVNESKSLILMWAFVTVVNTQVSDFNVSILLIGSLTPI